VLHAMRTAPARGWKDELRALDQAVRAVSTGHGSALVIEGPAGVGKSRLLTEAVSLAHRRGVSVAAGGADTVAAHLPFASLAHALRCADPPLIDDSDVRAPPGADESLWALGRLRTTLEDAAKTRPLMVVLDDLHVVEPLTLLAVRTLAAQLADSAVMWLLARRPAPSTPALDNLVSGLAAGGGSVIRLHGLPRDVLSAIAADLLGSPPDGALTALIDKCGGNPRLLVELLRTLVDDNAIATDPGGARLVVGRYPERLRDRLADGVGPLSASSWQLLEVASIFGQSFSVAPVAELLHRTVADILPDIQEAIHRDVLVEQGAKLAFCHAILRDATYDAIPASARTALHREAASSLRVGGGSPARHAAPEPAFGWGSLTDAEIRVARLAASGLTNREIAERLSRSPHTVDSHLRHAFTKLGIRSRVELTREVVVHELPQPTGSDGAHGSS
jgi:DNA-binding CsgD family transcriptional regulator/predicted ATPase